MIAVLLALSILELAAALAFGRAAVLTWRRPAGDATRLATRLFAVWWMGAGTLAAIDGVLRALAALDLVTPEMATAGAYLSVPVLCVALWGLLYYVAFVVTGKRALLAPITALYAALYPTLLYFVASRGAITVATVGSTVGITFAAPPDISVELALAVVVLGPHLVGIVAYALLFAKVEDATMRYRIALGAAALLAWVASLLVASVWGLDTGSEAFQLAARALQLAAAAAILLAYAPPAWVQRRWSVEPLAAADAAG